MIINPLLLSLGLIPQIASASGMYLVIFSAGASSILFIIEKSLLWQYAICFGISSCLGTILGITLVDKLVKKTGRQSLLVLILVILMIVALVVVPVNSGIALKEQSDQGENIMEGG